MSCESCDERAKKIDELLYTVKALKVDISGRSEITLLLQQKYEATLLQVSELRIALMAMVDEVSDRTRFNEARELAKAILAKQEKRDAPAPKCVCCSCGCNAPLEYCQVHGTTR